MALLRNEVELIEEYDIDIIFDILTKMYIDDSHELDKSKLSVINNGVIYDGNMRIRTELRDNIETLELPGITIEEVSGNFDCYNCKRIESLKGAPKKVGGNFICTECHSIEDLSGAPEIVGADLRCSFCTSLKLLNHGPLEVGGDLVCFFCDHLINTNTCTKIGGHIIDELKFT